MIVLFASGVLLASSSLLAAQRWGSDRRFPRDGACFYKDTDYDGEHFCVGSGEDIGSLPGGMNDSISSIKIFGRAEVTVFRDFRYQGRSTRFDYDVRDLRNEGWNDLVSSIRVRNPGFGGVRNDDSVRGGGAGRRGGQPNPDLIVNRAYQDILGRDPDPAGLRLYRSHIIDDGWSEAQVRDTLRNSPEYREKQTMTMPKAEDIVRRAYLAVLKREPDAGSRGYVNNVLRNHWTQPDVERELRNSAEYRSRNR